MLVCGGRSWCNLVPGPSFLYFNAGSKTRPGTNYHSAHTFQITQNLSNLHKRKTAVKLYRKLVQLLGISFHAATHLSQLMINGIDWVPWSCGLSPFLCWSRRPQTDAKARGGSRTPLQWSRCIRLVPHRLWLVFMLPTAALYVPLQASVWGLLDQHKKGDKPQLQGTQLTPLIMSWDRWVARNKIPSKWTSLRLLKFYVCGKITKILGNSKHMCTITHAHAIGTRPCFRPSVKIEKTRAGNEASRDDIAKAGQWKPTVS